MQGSLSFHQGSSSLASRPRSRVLGMALAGLVAFSVGKPAQAATLTINVSGTLTGNVSVIPTGQICGNQGGPTTCVFTIASGTALRITANSPSTPAVLSAGTGDASACATSTCAFTLNSDSSLNANISSGGGPFPSISLTFAGDGKGEVGHDNNRCQNFELGYSACTSFYAAGSTVTLQGQSLVRNLFSHFSGGTGDAAGCTTTPCQFTLNANATLVANFSALSDFSVSPASVTRSVGQITSFSAPATFTNAGTRSLSSGFAPWSGRPSLPLARFSTEIAVVNQNVYLLGGIIGGGPSNRLERFNPANDTGVGFTVLASLPTSRSEFAAAAVGTTIYAIGGHTIGGGPVATVEAYDTTNNTWTTKAPLPAVRSSHAAAVVDGLVYALGGDQNPGGQNTQPPLASLDAYNPTTNVWTSLSPMPTARTGLVAVGLDGKLYALGGQSAGVTSAAVEVYDPLTDQWTARMPLPAAKAFEGAVVIDGLIYAPTRESLEVYHPGLDAWTSFAGMNTPRSETAVGALDGRLWMAGGLTDGSNNTSATTAFESFRPPETTWWSSDRTVATINQNRTATPLSTGTATIRARAGVLERTATLVVSSPLAINSFTASNVLVAPLGSSTLSWSVSAATSLTLNGSPVSGPTGSQVVNPAVTTAYTLTATNGAASISRTVTVIVNDGTAGLGAPTVTSPGNGQTVVVTGVGFAWTSVGGASGYDIRVFHGSTGALLFSGSLSGGGSTSTLISLPSGTYRFSVRACSGGLTASACGSYGSVSFTVDPAGPSGSPSVTFPAQGANLTSSTQTLSWTAVSPNPALSGLTYEVLLRDLTAGTTALQINVPSPTLSTVFTMRSSTQYELKVRACQASCGPFSTAVTFALTLPPVPTVAPSISGCAVSGGNSLTCSWGAVTNADAYQVQMVQPPPAGPGGGALTGAAMQVSATTVTLPVPSGAATVFVAACNGNGCGPNATVGIIAAGPNPSQSNIGTPMGGTVVSGPGVLFTWNRVPGDTGSNTWYRLFVQDLSRQSAALDVFTMNNYYSAYFKAEGGRYDGLVISNPGLPGQATGPAQGFNVAGASATAPTMVSPGHNSVVSSGNIQLGWSPVPAATLYEYFVAVLGQGSASARGVTPGLLAQVPLTGAGAGTAYSGIVRACPAGATCVSGSDAGWGPWSNAPGGPGVTNFTVIPLTAASQFNGLYAASWSGGQSDGTNLNSSFSFTVADGVITSEPFPPISGSAAVLVGTVSASGAVSASIPASANGCSVVFVGQITSTPSGGATATGTYTLIASATCNVNSGHWTGTRG